MVVHLIISDLHTNNFTLNLLRHCSFNMQTRQHALFGHTYVQRTNICFGAISIVALGILLVSYIINLVLVRRAKLVW